MIISDLIRARLKKRYKRFLADVELEDGSQTTVHCPNPGSMKGCIEENSPVFIKDSKNPKRKLKYTWSLVQLPSSFVVVDTGFANKFVKKLVQTKSIPELSSYKYVLTEPRYMDGRFDLLLTNNADSQEPGSKSKYLVQPGDCLVEIKSTTLRVNDYSMFPDAKTVRGKKHLHNLAKAKEEGIRAIQFFMVNRGDTSQFTSAENIDPEYARTLKEVYNLGVEVLAYDNRIVLNSNKSENTYSADFSLGSKLPITL